MTHRPGDLPADVVAALKRASKIPDRRKRLDAIDKARAQAAYDYPHLFKTEAFSMQVKLKNVRLAFASGLWEAQQIAGEGKPAFNCSALLEPDHAQIKEIKDAMRTVAKEKWGDKAKAQYDLLEKQDRLALHDGDKKEYDGYAGNLYLSPRSATRPLVVNKDKTPLTEADGIVYSGCYVNMNVDIWAMDNKYGKRVCCSLQGVQFVRDGDAFSGTSAATVEDFDDLGADAGGEKVAADGEAW